MYEYAALWGELSIRKSYIHGQICDSCIGAAFQIEIQDTHALFHISFFFFQNPPVLTWTSTNDKCAPIKGHKMQPWPVYKEVSSAP